MNVMIISAHPDDETLGAGGTILKHIANGDKVSWFLATAAYKPRWDDAHLKQQEEYVEKMCAMYGLEDISWPRFPTTCLDQIPLNDIIPKLNEAMEKFQPEWIYIVGDYDVHTDHAVVNSALLTTIKSFNLPPGLKRIMSYEIISSTDVYPAARSSVFVPNVYSDISGFIDRKLEIMAAVQPEMHEYPLPRSADSIRALARYRGSVIGVEYAEAFKLIFEVF